MSLQAVITVVALVNPFDAILAAHLFPSRYLFACPSSGRVDDEEGAHGGELI
jgi:hypothetical protein